MMSTTQVLAQLNGGPSDGTLIKIDKLHMRLVIPVRINEPGQSVFIVDHNVPPPKEAMYRHHIYELANSQGGSQGTFANYKYMGVKK